MPPFLFSLSLSTVKIKWQLNELYIWLNHLSLWLLSFAEATLTVLPELGTSLFFFLFLKYCCMIILRVTLIFCYDKSAESLSSGENWAFIFIIRCFSFQSWWGEEKQPLFVLNYNTTASLSELPSNNVTFSRFHSRGMLWKA